MTNEKKAEKHLQVDERIERYILNKMSEQEASEFEAYFLSNQSCLEQLEIAEQIHQGLLALQQSGDMQDMLAKQKAKKRFWQKPVPLWSLAATVCLVLLIPIIQITSQGSGEADQIRVVNIELASVRGEGENTIELNLTGTQTLLSFYVDTETPQFDHPSYGFQLSSEDNQIVFRSTNLTLNNASTLFVNLGNMRLAPGSYFFEVFGSSGNDRFLMQSGHLEITD
ncbi:hypothetical protein [Glaciecola sp. 1036]|uniref:hypothetical protein n=1 Tax=Alteromonadaceae TaxID=72275 RepID=UPI003D0450DC